MKPNLNFPDATAEHRIRRMAKKNNSKNLGLMTLLFCSSGVIICMIVIGMCERLDVNPVFGLMLTVLGIGSYLILKLKIKR